MIMKRNNNGIILTLKEAEKIMNLLYTLEATSGAYDDEYTKDAQLAGKYGNKLLKCLKKNGSNETRRNERKSC